MSLGRRWNNIILYSPIVTSERSQTRESVSLSDESGVLQIAEIFDCGNAQRAANQPKNDEHQAEIPGGMRR